MKNFDNLRVRSMRRLGSFLIFGLSLGLGLILLACGPDGQAAADDTAAGPDTLSAREHFQLGVQNLYQAWDYAAAKMHLERALALDPEMARAHAQYAWYLQLEDRFPEAIEHIRRAAELEPDKPVWRAWVGWICYDAGDLDCAETEMLRAHAMNPELPSPQMVMGALEERRGNHEAAAEWFMALGQDSAAYLHQANAYALLGEEAQARRVIAEVLDREGPPQYVALALVYVRLGDEDAAIDMLRKGYEVRQDYMPFIRVIPGLDALHDDPRFVELADQIGRPA